MRKLLTSPVFEDPDQTQLARLLYTILWAVMAWGGAFIVISPIAFSATPGRGFLLGGSLIIITGLLMVLTRRGFVRPASVALILLLWVTALAAALTAGGVRSPAFIAHIILISIASLLLGQRAGALMVGLITLEGLGLVVLEERGLLPPPAIVYTSFPFWLVNTVMFFVVFALQYLAARAVREALARARAELAERKRAEAALRASEERYRLISTVSSDYMFSTRLGPDGVLHPDWVAGAFEKITGYTLEEHTARGGWLAALHPDDLAQDARDMDLLRTNKPAITEVRTIHKDGSIRWVRSYAHPLWDAENNRLAGIYGAVQDITERKQAEERIQRSANQLATLNQIGRAVATLTNFDTVLRNTLEQIRAVIPLDVFFVALFDAANNTVAFPLFYDSGQIWKEPVTALSATSWTAQAIRTRQPFLVNRSAEELQAALDNFAGDTTRKSASLMFVPMVIGEKVIGVISAHSYAFNAYTAEHLTLLTGVAYQVAIAVENARLFEAEKRQVALLKELHETSLDLRAQLDLPTLLRTIMERAARLLQAPMGGLYLLQPDGKTLTPVANLPPEDVTGPVQMGEGMVGRVTQTGDPLVVADYTQWPGRLASIVNPRFRAVVTVPIQWQGRSLGALSVCDPRPARFGPDDVEIVRLLAAQAAVAIKNAQLVQRLEILHEIDRTILAAHSPEKIAEAALSHIHQLVPSARSTVSIFDFQANQVVALAAHVGEATNTPANFNLSAAELETVDQLRQGQALVVEDVLALPHRSERYEQLLVEGIRTWMHLPLMAHSELIGVLNLGAALPGAFTAEHLEVAREIADQLAIAIQHARLLESTRRQVRELFALHLIATACVEAATETALLERVTNIIGETFFAGSFGILLVDETLHALRVHPTYRGISDTVKALIIPLGERVVGKVAARGRPWRVADVQSDPNYISIDDVSRSQLCVPLKVGERVIGVINADSPNLNAFSEADERLLVTAAGQLASTLARLRAEAGLRESEALYRRAIEVADAVPYYIDHATNTYQFIGAGIERLTGYAPAEITPRVWRSLVEDTQVLGEAANLSLEEADRLAYAGQLTMWRADNRIRTRAGEIRWINNSSVEILAEAGRSIGAIGILQDITERKEAEEAIRRLNEDLEQRVAERTEELHLANEALAKAARLKDEFLASMSHELRTPLTGILAFSQTLQKQTVYGALNEKQHKAVRSIEDSGKHLLELINDVLDLSKIEAGKMELELGLVAAEEIGQASLRLVKQMAANKRQNIGYSLQPLDLRLTADARRLKQMLVNLLNNAIKFTPEGGALGLEVEGDNQARVVRFTIWDKGIGIAPEDLSRLFQSFVQLDSSLSRQQAGTGLGLALVRRMAEMHGGGITVASEPGQGSRFTLALPWQLPAENAPRLNLLSAFMLPARADWPRQALIVEDSPVAAAQLTAHLNELGLTNVVYPHAAGVIEKVVETQPGVILLDLFLPDESGWNVLARLKADPRTSAIPVIIISVMEDRARAAQLGADDYLVKPVARIDLQNTLERVWARVATRAAHSVLVVEPLPERPRLLLAEDNEVNIGVLTDYLQASGYEILVARNGSEAVQTTRAAQPALILMDIQMPGMDGLEATRLIRQDPALARVPIIALTALAMPGDRERCLAAGANDYLTKPVNLEKLVETIKQYLQT